MKSEEKPSTARVSSPLSRRSAIQRKRRFTNTTSRDSRFYKENLFQGPAKFEGVAGEIIVEEKEKEKEGKKAAADSDDDEVAPTEEEEEEEEEEEFSGAPQHRQK